jgi:hypothetical protein
MKKLIIGLLLLIAVPSMATSAQTEQNAIILKWALQDDGRCNVATSVQYANSNANLALEYEFDVTQDPRDPSSRLAQTVALDYLAKGSYKLRVEMACDGKVYLMNCTSSAQGKVEVKHSKACQSGRSMLGGLNPRGGYSYDLDYIYFEIN